MAWGVSFSKGCVKGLNSAQFYIVAIKQFETEILFLIDFIKLCENTVILYVVILTQKCIFYLGRGMGSNDSEIWHKRPCELISYQMKNTWWKLNSFVVFFLRFVVVNKNYWAGQQKMYHGDTVKPVNQKEDLDLQTYTLK